MEQRLRTLVILLILVVVSCTSDKEDRFYTNLCFSQEYLEYSIEPVVTDGSSCKRYPDVFFTREFPVDVLADPAHFQDTQEMALQINQEVGRPVFTVTQSRIFDTIDNFPGDVLLIERAWDTCKEPKNCLGLTSYFRHNGRLKVKIEIFTNDIKDSLSKRAVIKHELGHSLGLRHSSDEDSLMFKGTRIGFSPKKLSNIDVKLVRDLTK